MWWMQCDLHVWILNDCCIRIFICVPCIIEQRNPTCRVDHFIFATSGFIIEIISKSRFPFTVKIIPITSTLVDLKFPRREPFIIRQTYTKQVTRVISFTTYHGLLIWKYTFVTLENEMQDQSWISTLISKASTNEYNRISHEIELSYGAVHKVCHAPGGGGGLRKCDSLWQGEGVKIMWRHTFSFFTIHNLMFHLIFYLT